MKPFIFQNIEYSRAPGIGHKSSALIRFASTELLSVRVHWVPTLRKNKIFKIPYRCLDSECCPICKHPKQYTKVITGISSLALLSYYETIDDETPCNYKPGPALFLISKSMMHSLYDSVGQNSDTLEYVFTDIAFAQDKNFLVQKAPSKNFGFTFNTIATLENRICNLKGWTHECIKYLIENDLTIHDQESGLAVDLAYQTSSLGESCV